MESTFTLDNLIKLQENFNNTKLKDANTEMLLRNGFEYYGEFNLGIAFHKSNIPTAGVNFTLRGPQFYYNEEFCNKLTIPEAKFLLIHEDSHLLWNHPKRTSSMHEVNFKTANIVQDMIINSLIRFSFKETDVKVIKDCYLVPNEYQGDWIFEKLYDWLKEKENEEKGKGSDSDNDQKDSDKSDQSGDSKTDDHNNNPDPSNGKAAKGDPTLKDVLDAIKEKDGQPAGQIDTHLKDEVPAEFREKMIEEVKERLKGRGLENGNVKKFLEGLTKPRHDYLKDIKRQVANIKGSIKSKTYARPNRRGFEGFKGVKKEGVAMNIIIDTSGSMYGYLEKCLGVLLQDELVMNIVQCDMKVHDVCKVKSMAQFKKIQIKGGGGTAIQPAIEYVKEHLNINLPLVIITDGETDNVCTTGAANRTLVLTVDTLMPIAGPNVKQVVIKDY